MPWHLTHRFAGLPCDNRVPLTRGFRRSRRPPCPSDHGLDVGDAVAQSLTSFLKTKGIDYPPSDGENRWLWCLGGPDLFRGPLDDEYAQHIEETEHACIDLNLYVCDEHQVISLELYPYDIVPERGGRGPDDPTQSTPIPIGETEEAAGNMINSAARWLDSILIWPKGEPARLGD